MKSVKNKAITAGTTDPSAVLMIGIFFVLTFTLTSAILSPGTAEATNRPGWNPPECSKKWPWSKRNCVWKNNYRAIYYHTAKVQPKRNIEESGWQPNQFDWNRMLADIATYVYPYLSKQDQKSFNLIGDEVIDQCNLPYAGDYGEASRDLLSYARRMREVTKVSTTPLYSIMYQSIVVYQLRPLGLLVSAISFAIKNEKSVSRILKKAAELGKFIQARATMNNLLTSLGAAQKRACGG